MKKITSLMAAATVAFGLGMGMGTPDAAADGVLRQNHKIDSCSKDGKEISLYVYIMTHEQGAIDDLVKWYDQAFDKLAAKFTAEDIIKQTDAYKEAYKKEIAYERTYALDSIARKHNVWAWGYGEGNFYRTGQSCTPPKPAGP